MIDRIVDKLVKIPSVRRAVTQISKSVSTSIAEQPASVAQETRSSGTRSVVYNDEQYYAVDADTDTQTARSDLSTYLNLYRSLLWVFRGVHTIASNVAMVPLKVWEPVSPVERNEYKIHPIYKLWRNPNNLNTRFDLLFKTSSFMELAGEGYWFLEKAATGLPHKLHLPRPDRVESKIDGNTDKLVYTRQKQKSIPELWAMEDVVHFKHFNPISDYQGFPTVAAFEDNSIIELYLLLYGKTWFKNAIYPSQMFQSSARLSDATFERFHAEMKRLHAGVQNWGRVMLLDENIAPIDDQRKTPSDSEFLANRENTREEILMGLGCYHTVALLQGRSGSDLREAKRIFWEDTMLPRLTNIEETISKELLWSSYPESEDLVVQFDLRKIKGLRDDTLQESLANYRYWQMGVSTPNEIRQELGIDGKTEWGDERPPTMPTARSKTLPNEERAFLEASLPHPERYDESTEKVYNRLDDAASEIAFELNSELSDKSNGDNRITEAMIKDCLLKEWHNNWV